MSQTENTNPDKGVVSPWFFLAVPVLWSHNDIFIRHINMRIAGEISMRIEANGVKIIAGV